MGNFKVKVNTPEESKEVQDLFEVIGYEKGACSLGNYPAIIVTTQDWATGDYCSTRALGLDIPAHDKYKEITLPELRDMVVLKRNDVNDATHTDQGNWKWYISSNGNGYVWQCGNSQQLEQWDKAPLDFIDLKPIEKTMKEYLDKQEDGTYKLIAVSSGCVDRDWVEIPEGAIRARFYPHDPDGLEFENSNHQWWHDKNNVWINYKNYSNTLEHSRVVWQRTPSLKDQYAEIEQVHQASKDNVNQPGHYTQGNVECIDALESATIGKSGIEAVCVANVIKYLWRYEEKNGLEDVKKAQWYLERLVASMDS